MTKKQQKFITVTRIALGAIFVLSGLNGLFPFMPPPPMSARAALVWQGLAQSGTFFPLLRMVELAAGLLLLSGRAVPLALAALAPVIVNIAGFHLAVAPQALPMVFVLVACWVALAWTHRESFRPLLAMRSPAAPGGLGNRIVEITFGVVFVASAIAGALGKTPPPTTATAAAMIKALGMTGYFFPLLVFTQFVAGVMLIARRFVPLALVALAPITVEIVAYRLIAAGGGMFAVSMGLMAAEVWLAWQYRAAFARFFGRQDALAWRPTDTRDAGREAERMLGAGAVGSSSRGR